MILRRWLLAVLLCAGSLCSATQDVRAEGGKPAQPVVSEVVFAVGEWAPMIGENIENFGIHSKRVMDVFKAMGYRVRLEFLPWQRAYEQTRQGIYVGTFSWLSTADRAAVFYVPDHPIARAYQKAFYKKSRFPGGLDLSSLRDIATLGLRPVGVGSYWYEEAYKRLGIDADIVTNPESAWRFLNAGRADVFVEEEEVGRSDMVHFLGDEAATLYGASEPIKTDDMFILFSRQHPDGKRLWEEFDRYMASDAGQELCHKWHACLASVHAPSTGDR